MTRSSARVVGRRGRQRHRWRRQLLALHQLAHRLLAQQADQDGVADARVVEVVAAQVGDAGDHPALDQREAGDVGRDGERHRRQPAEVGQRSPGRRRTGRGSRSPRGSPCRRRRAARRSCLSAATDAGGSGPMPWMARWSASRTNAAVTPGRELGQPDRLPARAAGARRVPAMPRSYVRDPECTLYRGARAGRPTSDHLGVPAARTLPPRRRPGRDRRRPGAGDGAGGVPLRALPDAHRRPSRADGVVQPGTPRHAAAARPPRLALAGEVGAALRDPGRHRLCRGHRRLRRPTTPVGLDRRPDPRRVPPPPRARLGALGRDLARRPARRGACTAWRSAGCSPASRCSTARPMPRRSRCWRWRACSTTVTTGWSTPSGRPRTWPRSGSPRSRGREYLRLLAEVLPSPQPTSTARRRTGRRRCAYQPGRGHSGGRQHRRMRSCMRNARTLVAGALVLAGVLAACGSGSSPTSAGGSRRADRRLRRPTFCKTFTDLGAGTTPQQAADKLGADRHPQRHRPRRPARLRGAGRPPARPARTTPRART